MNIPMKAIDAGFFLVEKPEAPVHFGPLIIMSIPTGSSEDYVAGFVAKWRACNQFAPPFNYQLKMGARPSWRVMDNSEIDIDYHLRHSALPAPGGEKELGQLISRLHSHPLDRDRPLWECHVIEGLENNRFAIYLKLHHGQLDGMGSVQLMNRTFTPNARGADVLPPWGTGMQTAPQPKKTLRDWISQAADFANLVKTAPSVTTRLAKLYADAALGKKGAASAPFEAPHTVLNNRIQAARRYATMHFPLKRFKAIAAAANVTVNDVFLAVCSTALREYLFAFGELPTKPLIAQVPVNIREKDNAGVGNAVAFIFVDLATNIPDPVMRLERIHASTVAGKSVHRKLPKIGIEPYTMLLQGPYILQVIMNLSGRMSPAANLVISNVQGPPKRIYCNGARVEQIYGPSVLFHGQALNITISSYADEVNMGFTACRNSVPKMQRIAVSTQNAVSELESAYGIASAPKRKKKTKKKAVTKGKARSTREPRS
jgi:diacylglycerol O-acyltransferase / wax synthase